VNACNTVLRRHGAKLLTNSAQYIIYNDASQQLSMLLRYTMRKPRKEIYKIYIITLKIVQDYFFLQRDPYNGGCCSNVIVVVVVRIKKSTEKNPNKNNNV